MWVREMQYVMKGTKKKVSDTYSGLVTYLNGDRDLGYVYSPLLNKGFKFRITEQKRQAREVSDSIWASHPIVSTGESKEIEGLTCEHYKGQTKSATDLLGSEITVTYTVDYWACKDFPEEEVGPVVAVGMPVSLDLMEVASFPIIGNQKQHQNIQLMKVDRREVDDKELVPPGGVNYTLTDKPLSTFHKLQKEVVKYMKKNKMKDNGVKVNHGSTELQLLDDAWD